MDSDIKFNVNPVISTGKDSKINPAIMLGRAMIGTVAVFSLSFNSTTIVESKELSYTPSIVISTPTKELTMEKKRYKPTRERLRIARQARLAVPNRGTDEEYARAIADEMEELKKVRGRAKSVSLV